MTCAGCSDVGREIAARPTCRVCKRTLRAGESAWADDWTVIDENGTRRETRYTCDDCATEHEVEQQE